MKIHSLKFRLSLIMAAVITIVVVLICVFNYAFFEKYYINDRLKLLKNSYNEMKELCLSEDYKIDDVKEFISQKDSKKLWEYRPRSTENHKIRTYVFDVCGSDN